MRVEERRAEDPHLSVELCVVPSSRHDFGSLLLQSVINYVVVCEPGFGSVLVAISLMFKVRKCPNMFVCPCFRNFDATCIALREVISGPVITKHVKLYNREGPLGRRGV